MISALRMIHVYPFDTPPEASSVYICQGDNATINVTSINGGNLTWYDASSGGNNVNTGNSLSLTPSSNTSYWIEETDNNGCISLRQQVDIGISPLLAAPTTTSVVGCSGELATMSASGS